MMVIGEGSSRAQAAALRQIAEALAGVADEPGALWVVGAPRASDWPTIATWNGEVHALVTPGCLYQDALIERADTRLCFGSDEALLTDAQIMGSIEVPRIDTVSATAPPPLGTPLGDVWKRRLEGRRALPETCGVAWVGGAGSAAMADASDAWARGRAVIAYGEEAMRPLAPGAALPALTALEVDEATSFLDECPAIARALARAGIRGRSRLPTPEEAALSLVDAVRLGSLAGSG